MFSLILKENGKTPLVSQLVPVNTLSRFPSSQCVMELRTGWGGGVNNFSSLSLGCTQRQGRRGGSHKTCSPFSTILGKKTLNFFFLCFNSNLLTVPARNT